MARSMTPACAPAASTTLLVLLDDVPAGQRDDELLSAALQQAAGVDAEVRQFRGERRGLPHLETDQLVAVLGACGHGIEANDRQPRDRDRAPRVRRGEAAPVSPNTCFSASSRPRRSTMFGAFKAGTTAPAASAAVACFASTGGTVARRERHGRRPRER